MSSDAKHFWSRVLVGDIEECWPFEGARTGGRNGDTYGYYGVLGTGKMVYAHRYAFCLANGFDIADLGRWDIVRHECDNPTCCNPTHLVIGSQKENAQDMVTRGRSLRGEIATRVILSELQVHIVRRRLAAGHRHRDIAKDFGVSRPAVSLIHSGKNWGWLPSDGTYPADNDNAASIEAAS